ncbi:hypothetical protein U1Q18_006330 [Sarracenia purpurea var. burkii]
MKDLKDGMLATINSVVDDIHKGNEDIQSKVMAMLTNFEARLEEVNLVADALSRKAELAAAFIRKPQGELIDLLKEGLQHDPLAKSLITLAMMEKPNAFEWRMAYSTQKGKGFTFRSGKAYEGN